MPEASSSSPRGVPRTRLVIATGNAGKLREFRALLADLPFDLVGQGELGVTAPAESGTTFFENALLKARYAADVTGSAAIADDSGLEVDVLGGAPGIHSARYAGAGGAAAADTANNAKLVAALAGVPLEQRRARYRCVLVFVAGPGDPEPLTAEGVWEGTILEAPRGTGGFGYDAYFWLAERSVTAAELDPREKNRVSHRGIALRTLRERLAVRESTSKRAAAPAARR